MATMDPQVLNGKIVRGTPLYRIAEALRIAPPTAMSVDIYAGEVNDVLMWIGEAPGNKLVADLTDKVGDDPSRLMRLKPADLTQLVELAKSKSQ